MNPEVTKPILPINLAPILVERDRQHGRTRDPFPGSPSATFEGQTGRLCPQGGLCDWPNCACDA